MPQPLPLAPISQWDDSLFETVVATAINGIVVIDDRGLIRVFNAACERMFHYRRAEVIGHPVSVLLAPSSREEYENGLQSLLDAEQPATSSVAREVSAQRKDGSAFPIYLSVGEGMLHSQRMFVAVIQDISAQQMERAVHAEQRAFLAAIVDSSNDGIISKTLDGIITSWNKGAEKIFGYTAAEMIGTPVTRLFPEDLASEEERILGMIRSGDAIEHYETVRTRKDGKRIDVSVTVSPIRDSNGKVIGASKTVRDITERKLTEARLQALASELSHVARVSEMGQVSAAIAHELNQPLTAVLNYTNVAKRLVASTEESAKTKAYEAVSKAGEQAVRASQIIRRLRDFVEKRESTRTLEDINAITEDSLALGLIGTKSTDIKTTLALASDLPPVFVDRVQIQQVLVNLLRNAAEAMSKSERRELIISTAVTDGGTVEVIVADTGPGISAELAERLFKPFVTTKPGGMGIGLAISRSIVEAHGGRLTLSPNPGGGTAFQFTLPVANSMVE